MTAVEQRLGLISATSALPGRFQTGPLIEQESCRSQYFILSYTMPLL